MKGLHVLRLFFALTLLLVVIACQEDSYLEEEIPETDKDMIAASQLADDYLNSIRGRDANAEKSITVLRYYNGKLFFATNTDEIEGYQELTETSVTAIVEPGEYLFWYSGEGVTDLDGIEFDPNSQDDLDEFPEEINEDNMWKIQVPDDGNLSMYKYDILYKYKGTESPIRLDPKIRVKNDEEE